MRQKKATSLQDIAEKAGVSIATVSRVINKKGNVKPETKSKIENLLATSGYITTQENQEVSSNTIAVLIPNFSNPFNSLVLEGIRRAAKLSNFKVVLLFASERNNEIDYYLDLINDVRVLGIISLSAFPNIEVLRSLNNIVPVVMCAEHLYNSQLSYVSIDDETAAYEATNYLIKSGCSKIAHVNSTLNHKYAKARENGFRRALAENNLEINEKLILHLTEVNYQLALPQITYLLEHNNIDGIFASADIFAIATISAAKKLNRRIPEELSIIGFDNIDLSVMTTPKLTTMAQPAYELGFQSCEILKGKILNNNLEEKQLNLPTNLVIRETTR